MNDDTECVTDDSVTENSEEEINVEQEDCASLLFTNARSLLPKIDSLTSAFQSLSLHGAGITETWFKGGKGLKERLDELEDSVGIKIIHKSRDGRKKKAGGGVAFAFCTGTANFKQLALKSMTREQEVLAVVGRVAGVKRKIVVFTIYVPPATRATEFEVLCNALTHEIAAARAALNDPIIIVGGDFNRKDVGPALQRAADLKPIETAPTRGVHTLDKVYSTINDLLVDVRTLPPLDTLDGIASDHRCIFIKAKFPKARGYSWIVRMRRTRTKAREEAFARSLAGYDWSELAATEGVDEMVEGLERAIGVLTEQHFPLARVRRRSNEDPWISRKIRRLWKKKIRAYKQGGKTEKWWRIDSVLQEEIKVAREDFVERLLTDGNSGRSFYAATKKLSAAKSVPTWSVNDLFVGMNPGEVCTEVLSFFGGIAKSDSPGIPDFPRVPGGLPKFTVESTTKMLRNAKKTGSIVAGDPLPGLIRAFPDQFAVPVSMIYNRVNDTGYWPSKWKKEHLTVIPKVPNPTDLSQCRNISCTSAFSKVLENQVLLKLRRELDPDPQQYGGVQNCGVEHLLVDIWEKVLSDMEGGKTASVILGVDYEKAFNRMEHSECIEQLRRLGATEGSVSLVRAFLEDRKMTITIGGQGAEPVSIQRGSPQGSVLGCLLYCATTQNLTKELRGNRAGPPMRAGTTGVPCPTPDHLAAFMYVDDTTLVDRVETSAASLHITTATTKAHLDGLAVEEDFRELNLRAGEIKMKINESKTQLLVIGPPTGHQYSGSLIGPAGSEITGVENLKLVGFTFGCKPGAAAHVRSIEERFRRKVWMLYHLRDSGFKGRQLYRLYCCYIRVIIEYCSVVYHPMLTAGLEEDLERMHRLAVKICFGFDAPTDEVMRDQGIESLKARRSRGCA